MIELDISAQLQPLFRPESVAVIGASNNKAKWGFSSFYSLKEGYPGRLYAVNNRDESVQGYRAYDSVADIPDKIDLVVIVVPPEAVPSVMEDCVTKGVKAAVIITAGFAEVGYEGKALQDKVLSIAQKGGIRFVGPNCMGMWSAAGLLPAFMFPMAVKDGPLALISQGGNIGGALVADAMARGVGFSQYVSCGCTADIQIEDYIEYLGNDDSVKVILVYIEGLGQANRFVEKVGAVTMKKPVVVLKPGKTEAAARAISSHSGALSGSDRIYDAAFKKAGVIRTNTSMELLDVAIALLTQPLPPGRNVVITTPGGSYGVMCAEACALNGLNVIDLPPGPMEAFNKMFPSRWSRGNPVDPAGDRDFAQYLRAPELLLPCPEIDALIFMGFGSFSALTSVFASGRKNEDEESFIASLGKFTEFAGPALNVIESGDPLQIKEILKAGLKVGFKKIMLTSPEDMDIFLELLTEALTTEKMLAGPFFARVKELLALLAEGDLDNIALEDVTGLMDPMLGALIHNWTRKYKKPVIATTFTEVASTLSDEGHFPYPNAERAANVLARLVEYQEYKSRLEEKLTRDSLT